MNRVEIKVDSLAQTVAVDGNQVHTVSVLLDLKAGRPPLLAISLPVINDDTSVEVGARVVVDEPTHQALVAMGWKPPEGG